MKLNIDSFDIQIKGYKNQLRILQISDLHLTCLDEYDLPIAKEELPSRKELFDKEINHSCDRSKYLEEFYQFAERNNCDIVMITGDVVDAPSVANMRLLRDTVNNSKLKTVYFLGNHDWTFTKDYQSESQFEYAYPLFADIFGEKTVDDKGNISVEWDCDNEVYDYGDFVLFCVNNGKEQYSEEAKEKLEFFKKEKIPVILFTHIPFSCKGNKNDVCAMWGRDINIGSDDLTVDTNTKEFKEIIFGKDSPVLAVICGHTHQNHIDKLSEHNSTVQYTLGASFHGYARIFNIVGC